MKDVVLELNGLLAESVRSACDRDEMGIILSGGLDSTLIGIIASRFSRVTGYVVGIKGSPDVEYAKEESGGLGFDVRIIEINDSDVEKALPAILKAIGEPNPLKLAVGVPFYFASKNASDDGIEVMLCGQGSDELFGGYNRYVEAVPGGMENVRRMMEKDVREIFEQQLQYDSRICEMNGVELRFPFMDDKFVSRVLDLPVGERIRKVDDDEFACVDDINGSRYVRKYMLRKMAREFDVPEKIINRPKKAAQYGSGVQKVIDRIARREGYREKAKKYGRNDYLRFYVEDIYKSPANS